MAPRPKIDRVTAGGIFSNHSKLDPGVLQLQNSTSNITMRLPKNESPRVRISTTNQPHSPFPIPNTSERTFLSFFTSKFGAILPREYGGFTS